MWKGNPHAQKYEILDVYMMDSYSLLQVDGFKLSEKWFGKFQRFDLQSMRPSWHTGPSLWFEKGDNGVHETSGPGYQPGSLLIHTRNRNCRYYRLKGRALI